MRRIISVIALLMLVASAYVKSAPQPQVLPKMQPQTVELLKQFHTCTAAGEYEKVDSMIRLIGVNRDNYVSLGFSSFDMTLFCIGVGKSYNSLGRYAEALNYLHLGDSIYSASNLLMVRDFSSIYGFISDAYKGLNMLDKAAEYADESLSLIMRHYGRNSIETADAMHNVAMIEYRRGNLAKAATQFERYVKIKLKIIPEEEATLADIADLFTLCTLWYNLNNVEPAYKMCKHVESTFAMEAPQSMLHLRSINMLVALSLAVNPAETEQHIHKIVAFLKSVPDDADFHADLVVAINNVAMYYADNNPQQALYILAGIIDGVRSKDANQSSALLPTMLNNYAFLQGIDCADSRDKLKEAFQIIVGTPTSDVADLLMIAYNLISSHVALQEVDSAVQVAAVCQQLLGRRLRDSFCFLPEEGRMLYWNQVKGWYQEIIPDLASVSQSDAMNRLWYDALLQSRSILLSSSVALSNLVMESADPQLQRTYSQIAEAGDMEAGERLRVELERRLLSDATKYGSYMEVFNADHASVAKRLKPGEVAVEFVRYADSAEADSLSEAPARYYALLLRGGSDAPLRIDLCAEADLPDDVELQAIYKYVWQPLEPYLDGISTIYFSPDGKFFSMPVEYARCPDGSYLWDKYLCRRLTSTRELLARRQPAGEGISLFGGMKYDLSVDRMVEDASKYKERGEGVTRAMAEERGDRDVLLRTRPLPGTLKEAQAIKAFIDGLNGANAQKAKLFTGEMATEAAFKSKSGKRERILHIGTHGFYDKEQQSGISGNNPAPDKQSMLMAEKEAMSLSGLLFSGVDNVRYREQIPEGIDDGVLYAYEISNLDLSSTDLVSLSACRTALGKISGDGVFGLQRGFKKAGVNSILMSLWSVDDDATCEFMTQFFRLYLGDGECGGNKSESLKEARKALMSQKKWNHPKYWAPFILLDALD